MCSPDAPPSAPLPGVRRPARGKAHPGRGGRRTRRPGGRSPARKGGGPGPPPESGAHQGKLPETESALPCGGPTAARRCPLGRFPAILDRDGRGCAPRPAPRGRARSPGGTAAPPGPVRRPRGWGRRVFPQPAGPSAAGRPTRPPGKSPRPRG
ncbi:hypothetical protein SLNWT_4006 [Streptomyces albus]|uniref:Uncharacterized protein n=1 Tax=Streptomyces albus (strain ATCC 21838 / DSM 41398 / FERM P-419 / JCM 4703 / NBRC 107858) TaxID=1081613 RepID=A0A0B5F252_STRA4|nr:hypothetical protein SLNWT_4006 [Streptomyces albus]AOU78690.1 hypothetical protein SLNHY_3999 [Streptomyces albus]